MDDNDFTDRRIKHLDMIQAVIARLNSNSSAMKRYCLITVAVGIGAYKLVGTPIAVPALMFIVVVFCTLDAMYLKEEKAFRYLHDEVRREPPYQQPDFRLSPRSAEANFWDGLASWAIWPLYLSLVILLAVLWLLPEQQ